MSEIKIYDLNQNSENSVSSSENLMTEFSSENLMTESSSENLMTDLNAENTKKIKGGLTRNTNSRYLGTLLG